MNGSRPSTSSSEVDEKTQLLQNDSNHPATVAVPLQKNDMGLMLPAKPTGPMRRRRKKEQSLAAQCCAWIVSHQTGLATNLLLLLLLVHLCFPKSRHYTYKFVELSYYNPETEKYRAGWDDAFLVTFWIVVFTGARTATMDYILIPFGAMRGIKTKKDLARFAEQGWLLIYCLNSFSLGIYVMYTSEYWLNLKMMWADWPVREIDGLRKWYILVQYAFWLQQIVVVNIEERRKDYMQMFTHHIVTCVLIFTSYGYHQTRVANVILSTMDVVDIVLPLAKCLKYLGHSTMCDIMFGVFMLVWVISRHIIYPMICWSVWKDIPNVIDLGCYKGKQGALTGPFPSPAGYMHLIDPFRDPEGIVCFNENIKWFFLSCLLFLEVLTLVWFYMIVQVAVKVLRGGAADDNRSDDEEEDDEEEDEVTDDLALEDTKRAAQMLPLEEEVGVEAINLKGRTRPQRYRTAVSTTTGVTIPGHSDRKELLGRIGCDKGV